MMDREQFLSEHWRQLRNFPCAPKSGGDASEFLAGKTEFVCGRLALVDCGTIYLSSGGVTIEFTFADDCQWLKLVTDAGASASPTTVPFSPLLLRDGDLLCLKLTAQDGTSWVALGCELLVPSSANFEAIVNSSVARSREWMTFQNSVRDFFRARDFIEVVTPTLVPSPGTEPFLDPFETEWQLGSRRRRFFLPTSPEFHLKKLLSAGWTRIFELKTCFRNGELSATHQPEFTMLEWYRAYRDLDAIEHDVSELLSYVASQFGETRFGTDRASMSELFERVFSGFTLKPDTPRDDLVALAKTFDVRVEEDDSWDDLFARLFIEKIESDLGRERPLIVHGYPSSQAALARLRADGFADRFEVYWRGLEIANAFHELNDPKENRQRFEADRKAKVALQKKPVPIDEDFLQALEYGMPPSGGIALGLDRLFMAILKIKEISQTRPFPIQNE